MSQVKQIARKFILGDNGIFSVGRSMTYAAIISLQKSQELFGSAGAV